MNMMSGRSGPSPGTLRVRPSHSPQSVQFSTASARDSSVSIRPPRRADWVAAMVAPARPTASMRLRGRFGRLCARRRPPGREVTARVIYWKGVLTARQRVHYGRESSRVPAMPLRLPAATAWDNITNHGRPSNGAGSAFVAPHPADGGVALRRDPAFRRVVRLRRGRVRRRRADRLLRAQRVPCRAHHQAVCRRHRHRRRRALRGHRGAGGHPAGGGRQLPRRRVLRPGPRRPRRRRGPARAAAPVRARPGAGVGALARGPLGRHPPAAPAPSSTTPTG